MSMHRSVCPNTWGTYCNICNLYLNIVAPHSENVIFGSAPSEDSDEPARSRSLIRIFLGRISDSRGCQVSSCGQRILWPDCTGAQADLSLHWVHMSEDTFSHTATHNGTGTWYSSRIKSNLNSSNANGSFTIANSNSFLSPYEILPIAQENKYLGIFSFFIMKLYVVYIH